MRKLSSIGFVGAFLAGCASSPPPAPAPSVPKFSAPGYWRAVDQVVLVTDASGTIYNNGNFPQAKSTSQAIVAGLPDGNVQTPFEGTYTAGFVGFGGDDRLIAPLGKFDRNALAGKVAELQPLGDINGMGGTTPMSNVLNEVNVMLKGYNQTSICTNGAQGATAVIVVSDGLPEPEAAEAALLAAKHLAGDHEIGSTCIHAVQVGSDPKGTEFMKSLAATSACGTYTQASQLADGKGIGAFVTSTMMAKIPDNDGDGVTDDRDECLATPKAAKVDAKGCWSIANVEFDTNKHDLRKDAVATLSSVASVMKSNPSARLQVDGNADRRGGVKFNQPLSERRTRSVMVYLTENGGTNTQVNGESWSMLRPLVKGNTKADLQINRNVQLKELMDKWQFGPLQRQCEIFKRSMSLQASK
jgi:outer membrane protein OmpA-like peptidoglycan-associated protein